MWYKGLILCFACIGFSWAAKGQQTESVSVHKDTLISLLQHFRAAHEINPPAPRMVSLGTKPVDRSKATRVKKRGFRVQIYSGNNRNEAYAVQSRFKSEYGDIDSYVTYDEPNYRVKVGDFTGRAAANNFMRELRSQYSNVFVFQEDIWVWE
ncbi:SPOR domain-containing protein [Sphingobacterium sp. SGG-5]|uniref:SPOR domain-containing protein n=1 Tax=Sphingobacterium sp. SGG-5 TaxID=2710881 RepID=UPI0013EDA481|nr:SPOR domain-containing protein [Sphingobacterium sp. SGG-5]NGM61034.1 SPOR domain-containing protein [Sphingobacterium sp. SGG-5]